jgi:hypothetical protein
VKIYEGKGKHEAIAKRTQSHAKQHSPDIRRQSICSIFVKQHHTILGVTLVTIATLGMKL